MSSCAEKVWQFKTKQAEVVQDRGLRHSSSTELQDGGSYALVDLDVHGKLRHSISFGNMEQCLGEQDALRRRNLGTEAQLNNVPAYSTNVASGDTTPVEKDSVPPTYPSLLSRLNFISFPYAQNAAYPKQQGCTDTAEHQPHPLTRSMSEVMLPSSADHCANESTCAALSRHRQHSDTTTSTPFHTDSARVLSCAHPLTRFDFSESECSTPLVSPRAPTSARTQPTYHADRCHRHIWQDDSHLSVHTCALSDAQDSPLASPTSLTSIGSFFSGLLPLLTSPEPSVRDCSGSVDLNGNEDSLGASTTSSVDSTMENLCTPVPCDPVAHRISQPFCDIPSEVLTPAPCALTCETAPLRTTVSLSTAFDMKLPSWPLPTAVLPSSCVVDSYCMMDEELAQSAASPSDIQQYPQVSAAPSPPPGKVEALMAAVDRELSGVASGYNTSAAIREQVPEHLLVQLMAIMSPAADIKSAEAEGVKAAVGPGALCGYSRHHVGRFERVQTSVDKSTGLTFICEKQPLRNRLHMYRTCFHVPNASIDTMQTYMLNDHIVRNANSSMLSYVRLEDPSAAADCVSSMRAPFSKDRSSATDSGFLYSKIRFPVIGARQYVACRRVWHLPAGQGFCIVSTACQHPGIIAQAKALEEAQGLSDKAWSTDFWAGYVVRPYEEDGIKGVEVASVTFDDLGVPAFLANNASVPGLWTGAKSFVDGFRSFEQTVTDCRASGQDIFSVVQDVNEDANSAQEGVPRRGWLRRLRRVALAAHRI